MEFDASLNPFLRCARDINTSLLNWPLKSAHGALTISPSLLHNAKFSNSFFSPRIVSHFYRSSYFLCVIIRRKIHKYPI